MIVSAKGALKNVSPRERGRKREKGRGEQLAEPGGGRFEKGRQRDRA